MKTVFVSIEIKATSSPYACIHYSQGPSTFHQNLAHPSLSIIFGARIKLYYRARLSFFSRNVTPSASIVRTALETNYGARFLFRAAGAARFRLLSFISPACAHARDFSTADETLDSEFLCDRRYISI